MIIRTTYIIETITYIRNKFSFRVENRIVIEIAMKNNLVKGQFLEKYDLINTLVELGYHN